MTVMLRVRMVAGIAGAAVLLVGVGASAAPDEGGREALRQLRFVRSRIAPTGLQAGAFDRLDAAARAIVEARETGVVPTVPTPARGFRGVTPPDGRLPGRDAAERRSALADRFAEADAELYGLLDQRQRTVLSGEWGITAWPLIARAP